MFLLDEKKADENLILKKFSLKGTPLNEVWNKTLKKKAVFVLNPARISWDANNQKDTTALNRNLLAYFRGFDDSAGTEIEYRYTERIAQQKSKEGNVLPKYTRKVTWTGKTMIVNKTDMFLFFFLNKQCLNSPFYEKGAEWLYKLKDTEAESDAVLNKGEALQACLEWINTLPASELRIKAKAMSVSENENLKKFFGGIKDISDKELKAKLTNAAIAYPAEFHSAFNSQTNDFYGAIEEAIETGLVVKEYSGNQYIWKFGKGAFKGTIIAKVPPGISEDLVLKDTISSDMANLFLKIKEGLAGISIEQRISGFTANIGSSDPKVLTTEDLVNSALEQDLIAYDRVNKTYHFVDEEGLLGEQIYDNNTGDAKGHKQNLIVHLDAPDGAELLASIKALTGNATPPVKEADKKTGNTVAAKNKPK